MATIDTTTIQGFDTMTAEQKLDALLKFDIPDKPDMSLYVSKETFDKKASETAELSKKLKEALDEDGKKKLAEEEAKAATAQEIETMKQEIETLRKEKTISDYKSNYLAQGYDDALAK